jgi:uncharacterized protein (TIGR02145 family)
VLKYRPLSITFTQPAAFTNGQSSEIVFTITGGVQSVTAVDVPRGWTVVPNVTDKKIVVTAPTTAARYTAAGTVTLLVSDGAERTVAQPLVLSCPPYVPPAELGISFTQPEVFILSETKEINFTTTDDATTVKILDIPANWTVDVAKSGNAGTFTVTAPGATASSGEAFVFVSDAAGKTVMRTLELKNFAAASTQTWTFGSSSLTWSSAIQIPECNKDDFTGDANSQQCRSSTATGGYYYNWPYVNTNKTTLCPSPWRVPTVSDFEALYAATTPEALYNTWSILGYINGSNNIAEGGITSGEDSMMIYWSSQEYSDASLDRAYYLYVRYKVDTNSFEGSPHDAGFKTNGFPLRCVR